MLVVQVVVRSWIGVLVSIGLVACGAGGPGGGDGGASPSAPTNVTATPGPGYVDVAWQHDGANVTGFVVERRVVVAAGALVRQQMLDGPWLLSVASSDDGEPLEVGSVGSEARSFRDVSVESGVTYRYAVRAVGSGGATSAAQESGEEGVTPAPPEFVVGSNPDPSRYLAAVVRDGDVPVAAANVSAFLIDHDDAFLPWRMYASSDEGGVALLEDFEARSWIPSGTYDVLVAAGAMSANAFVFALFEDVAVPGSVDVDLADPRLVEVDVTLDPESGHEALLEFGRQVRGWTLFSRPVFVGTGVTSVLLEPDRYETFTWYEATGDDPAMEIDEVDLTTARSYQLTLDEEQLVSVISDATLPATVADATARVCLRDARERRRHLFVQCPESQRVRVSPFATNVDADVRFDEGGSERLLQWHLGPREIAPPGGEVVLPFGGVITAEIDTFAPTYAPGDLVRVTGSVSDASGNPLEFVSTISRSPFRFESVRPTLLVVDATGETVYEETVWTLTASWGPEFTLADDAAPGEYVVTYRWDTGAYQGVLEATATFEVVTE